MEFYNTKKRSMEAASSKVTTDWFNHIHQCKAELTWKTDREAVKKAAYVRVKTKCIPRFSSWVEVLDPCHRSLWRVLDFDNETLPTLLHVQHHPLPRHQGQCTH